MTFPPRVIEIWPFFAVVSRLPCCVYFSAEHHFLWSPPAQAGAKNRKSCECVIFGAFMRKAVNIDFRHMPSVASQLARGEWKTKFE